MNPNRDELLSQLRRMDEYEFEHLIADVWEEQGWQTTVTSGSNDRGIDVVAEKTRPFSQKALIQAKRYAAENKIGSPDVQQYSSLRHQESGVDAVLVITTSSFSTQARQTANDLNVKLIDGAELCDLIRGLDSRRFLSDYFEITEHNEQPSGDDEHQDASTLREEPDDSAADEERPDISVDEELESVRESIADLNSLIAESNLEEAKTAVRDLRDKLDVLKNDIQEEGEIGLQSEIMKLEQQLDNISDSVEKRTADSASSKSQPTPKPDSIPDGFEARKKVSILGDVCPICASDSSIWVGSASDIAWMGHRTDISPLLVCEDCGTKWRKRTGILSSSKWVSGDHVKKTSDEWKETTPDAD